MSRIEEFKLPFPPKLMSTDKSPATMGASYAREIVNMYIDQDGAGSKRGGFSCIVRDTINDDIVKLVEFVPTTGDKQLLAFCASGDVLKKVNDAWELVDTPFSAITNLSSVEFGNKLILANGVDPVKSWDGTSFNDLEQEIYDFSDSLSIENTTTIKVNSDISLYKPGTKLKLMLEDENTAEITVVLTDVLSATEDDNGFIDVELTDAVAVGILKNVSVYLKPPAFRSLYVCQDRLWGMGEGAFSTTDYSNLATRGVVFFYASRHKS